MAVVKSNAYGHGLNLIVPACAGRVDYWGVNSYQEALAVRRLEKKTPILILGGNGEYDLPSAEELDMQRIEFALASSNAIDGWIQRGYARVPVHLKIDTGMGRIGIYYQEWPKFCDFLESSLLEKSNSSENRVNIAGLMTHFSNIEDNPAEHAWQQQERFLECYRLFRSRPKILQAIQDISNPHSFSGRTKKELRFFLSHSCATAGALVFPQAHLDMIRIGAGLYGLPMPCELERLAGMADENSNPNPNPNPRRSLAPVLLQWRGKIVHRARIPKGQSIGYENSFILQEDSDIAIVAIGYQEGYSRALSNKATVILPSNEQAAVIGKVSMNMTAIHLKDIKGNVRVGDFVTLLGSEPGSGLGAREQAHARIDCQSLANQSRRIPRELMTGLSPEIPREFA